MRLALIALAVVLPAASSAGIPVPPKPAHATPARICDQDLRLRNVRTPQGVRLKRLGELPPGDLTLTVLNQVGRCIEPVVVRQGIGRR